jgi:serine/threonine-protein kinase RsbW
MSDSLPKRQTVELENSCGVVDRFCRTLVERAGEYGFSDDDIFGIHLALEEAVTNAVKHGNSGDSEKKVTIEYIVNDKIFDITVTDQGNGFAPSDVPDPREEENIYKSGGRGLLLMRAYMDVVEYNQSGNSVHMVKHNKFSQR